MAAQVGGNTGITSIFKINRADPKELKAGLGEILREAKVSGVAYSVINVREIPHTFSGRSRPDNAHEIILDVSYWAVFWSWFNMDKDLIQPLLVRDFLKDTTNEEAKQELAKASKQAVKILLYLTKPNENRFNADFLECTTSVRSTPLFSVVRFKKEHIDKLFFSSAYKKEQLLTDLKCIEQALLNFSFCATRLLEAFKDHDLRVAEYRIKVSTSEAPMARRLLDEALHEYDHVNDLSFEAFKFLSGYFFDPITVSGYVVPSWSTLQIHVPGEVSKKLMRIFHSFIDKQSFIETKDFSEISEEIKKFFDAQEVKDKYFTKFERSFKKIQEHVEGIKGVKFK